MALLVGIAAPVNATGEHREGGPAQATDVVELTAQYTLLFRVRQYAKAIAVAERTVAAAEAAFGPDSQEVAQVLNDAGYLYQSVHEPAKAEPLHRRALAIRDRVFHADGAAVTQSLNNLAQVYLAEGRPAEAVPLLKRSVLILERNVSPTSPSLITALEQYAIALRRSGKGSDAEVVEARITVIRSAPPSGKQTTHE